MNKIKSLVKRAWRESREFNKIANIPLAILFAHILASGKTKTLLRLDSIIPLSKQPAIISYYIAHAQYLYGNYERARAHLTRILKKFPFHADATYLLCSIDEIEGDKEAAWVRIIKLVRNNRRLKTWLVMANLVSEPHEFDSLHREWSLAISCNRVSQHHIDVNNYIATAAQRAKLYSYAIKIWEDLFEQLSEIKLTYRGGQSSHSFSRCRAEKALLDMKALLEKHKVEFFLVSGTLLGCIREGRILSHDKDVDIGVWDNTDIKFLLTILGRAGFFYILPSRSEHVIRVKHVNGIAIDLFIHYREPNDYWHGGVKIKWSNTPFSLATYPFLDTYFNVPNDYHLYLKENYGDWQYAKKEFNSATDTTNASVLNQEEIKIHLLKESVYSRLGE